MVRKGAMDNVVHLTSRNIEVLLKTGPNISGCYIMMVLMYVVAKRDSVKPGFCELEYS